MNFELSQGNLNFWKKSGNFITTGHIFFNVDRCYYCLTKFQTFIHIMIQNTGLILGIMLF